MGLGVQQESGGNLQPSVNIRPKWFSKGHLAGGKKNFAGFAQMGGRNFQRRLIGPCVTLRGSQRRLRWKKGKEVAEKNFKSKNKIRGTKGGLHGD